MASSGNSLHWHKGRGSWESAGCQVPSLPQSSCGLCWLDLVQCGRSTCVEDIGICLGQAFKKALGDKRGICRYGDMLLPMDEALILSAADLSGRSFLVYELQIPTEKIGTFDTQLTEEFFTAFVSNAGITLHLRQLSGKNSHHIVEGAFKSVARSLRKAVAIDPDFSGEVPSTKGVLA